MTLSSNYVPGDGPKPCPVMVVGEAPGEEEDRVLRPFVGRAGKLLNETLASVGLPRELVYVTNVVPFRPLDPPNRKPTPDEIVRFSWQHLIPSVAEVQPRFVLLLGNTALAAATIYERGIMTRRGWIAHSKHAFREQAEVFATLHPSAALRNSANRNLFEIDLEQFAKRVYLFVQRDESGRLLIRDTT